MNPVSLGWMCEECREAYDDLDEAEACCDPAAEEAFYAEKARHELESAGQQRLPVIGRE